MFTLGLLLASSVVASGQAQATFPGSAWERRDAEKLGLDAAALDRIAEELGGRGCIVKDGYLAKTWGDQAEVGDWYSSAKPVLSTLLFFALQEGRVTSVDQPIADFGWPLQAKDQGITFRHLGAMTSGYARPEGPGEAWAYNDFAIQLKQETQDAMGGGVLGTHVEEHGFADGGTIRNQVLEFAEADFSNFSHKGLSVSPLLPLWKKGEGDEGHYSLGRDLRRLISSKLKVNWTSS